MCRVGCKELASDGGPMAERCQMSCAGGFPAITVRIPRPAGDEGMDIAVGSWYYSVGPRQRLSNGRDCGRQACLI